MILLAQRDCRCPAGERQPPSGYRWPRVNTRRQSRVNLSPAARLQEAWQRRGAKIRTVASAPKMTGLSLNGMRWLDTSPRRCQKSLSGQAYRSLTGKLAAAREPAVVSIQLTPNILSAIDQQVCRLFPPYLLPGSGEPFRQSLTSLRSMRTVSPELGNQQSFRRTHSALPGATGVDPSTGAAVHQTVAPEESE